MTEPSSHIERGTPAFRAMALALFAAGFSTFALLYCVQPLLPEFSREFGVSAAESSLALSLTTGTLAVAMLAASALSESIGRKSVMAVSLVASSLLNILAALMPDWHGILIARLLAGLTLSGLPAVAMAYLSEEVSPRAGGFAMGLYIGGNAIGGMAGRFVTGTLADLMSWRAGFLSIGIFTLAASAAFWVLLPASRHFEPRPLRPKAMLTAFGAHLRDPGLLALYAEAFLFMGGFVTLYNYLGYRLLLPPFSLSQTAISAIFLSYLLGTFSSAIVGVIAGKLGRRKVLWTVVVLMLIGVLLTYSSHVAIVIAGVATATFGFFGAHSVASSWVGRRAQHSRAQASSLYLFFYYLGSSVVGTSGGFAWDQGGWPAVAALVVALWIVAVALAVWLSRLQPLQTGGATP